MEAFTVRIMRQGNPNFLVYPAEEVHTHRDNYQLHYFYTLSSIFGHYFQTLFQPVATVADSLCI